MTSVFLKEKKVEDAQGEGEVNLMAEMAGPSDTLHVFPHSSHLHVPCLLLRIYEIFQFQNHSGKYL